MIDNVLPIILSSIGCLLSVISTIRIVWQNKRTKELRRIELARKMLAIKRQIELEEYLEQHLKELEDLKLDDLNTSDYAFFLFEEKELDDGKKGVVLDKKKKVTGTDTSGIA